MWGQSRRLYAAEFKCGVIKIGVTSMPKDRRGALLKHAGVAPIRMHYGQLHDCGYWAEQALIERMRRIAVTFTGREWFTGIRYMAARQLVDQVTRMAHDVTAKRLAQAA